MPETNMPLKRVTYILSLIFKSLEYEWIVRYLDRSKIELSFILLNPTTCELQNFLIDHGIPTYHVPFNGKKSYPRALFKVWRILTKIKPDAVNCNLLDANIIGLTAAKLCGVRQRIYTRHHSSFHHVFFPKGRYYDYYANALASTIVAVSMTVKQVLVDYENVTAEKIVIIPHGFGIQDFDHVGPERVDALRSKYGLREKSPVIGCISRYIYWKGVQYIVPAFREILKQFPNAILLLANARQGQFTSVIAGLLKDIPDDSYREIEFESDILAWYKLLDVFVHVPIDDHSEAFGRIYPECMAAEVPMVCTISGIAHELVEDGNNAIVVPYENAHAIAEAMAMILKDHTLACRLAKNARKSVEAKFSIERQKAQLEKLYLNRNEGI